MYNNLLKIFDWCYPLLRKAGLSRIVASYSSLVVNIIILCLLSYGIYFIFRYLLEKAMEAIARNTKTKFDDLLISNKTIKYISHLIPLLFIYKAVPIILNNYDYWEVIFGKLVGIYIIILILWIIRTIFNAVRDNLKLIPKYSDKPIDSYIQVIMIGLWIFGVLVIVSKIFSIKHTDLLALIGGSVFIK